MSEDRLKSVEEDASLSIKGSLAMVPIRSTLGAEHFGSLGGLLLFDSVTTGKHNYNGLDPRAALDGDNLSMRRLKHRERDDPVLEHRPDGRSQLVPQPLASRAGVALQPDSAGRAMLAESPSREGLEAAEAGRKNVISHVDLYTVRVV